MDVRRLHRHTVVVLVLVIASRLCASGSTEDKTLALQIGLARIGISPGALDGLMGPRTSAALSAARTNIFMPADLFTEYTITAEDVGRLLPLGPGWLGKSQQERLDYESLLELVAEKSWAHTNLILRLNPTVNWTNVAVGDKLRVPKVEPPVIATKAAFLRIFLSGRVLQAFDAETNLLVHFPCSVAAAMDKRPSGELRVETKVEKPNYTFNPEIFPESPEARQIGRKLLLPPGPNNPVGTVWIGLDQPGYGIHGTPRPEAVGRAETHGCFRLANWNAELLLKLVEIGTPVVIEP